MGKKQRELFENADASGKQETIFVKPYRNGIVEYIEIEKDRFDYTDYEIVRKEWLSKANCPAVTMKYGSVVFNVRAIRKLDECRFILILINIKKKSMVAKPCEEDDKDSVQWSRINKHDKVVPRNITGKIFTAQLFKDMKWDIGSTIKVLGTLNKCRDESIFEFNLVDAEAYLHLAEPSADDPKRRTRVPFFPVHWQGNYGQSYEENKNQIVTTFEGAPEGFVKITIPQSPNKKQEQDTINKEGSKR